MCVAVKGVHAFICVTGQMTDASPATVKDSTVGAMPTISFLASDPRIAEEAPMLIFPELGDAWDPKAPGYCVCAADSQPVDIGGSPFEKPTNSGKGGCTYWMVCHIKGVPGP